MSVTTFFHLAKLLIIWYWYNTVNKYVDIDNNESVN